LLPAVKTRGERVILPALRGGPTSRFVGRKSELVPTGAFVRTLGWRFIGTMNISDIAALTIPDRVPH
jgi:hypothetical protein